MVVLAVDARGRARRIRGAALAAAALLVSSLVVLAVVDGGGGRAVQVAVTPGQTPVEPVAETTTAAPTSTSTSTANVTTTTVSLEPTWHGEERLVAYVSEGELWLYGASGRTYRITFDGDERWEHSPKFSGRDQLTFVSSGDWGRGSTLEEIDLTTGRRRTVLASAGVIRDYDWTADRSAVGVLVSRIEGGVDADDAVGVLRAGSTEPVWLRSIGPVPGRGGFLDYDLMRVEWSPDDTKLLVVDTYADGDGSAPTLFVIRPDGSDVVAPRSGTWAVWAPDSRTVYFTSGRAFVLDTVTGGQSQLHGIERAVRLALSSDGRLLAYDDAADEPAVYVHDLAVGASRLLRRASLAPVWWSEETLLAGRTVPCPPEELDGCLAGGHGAPWRHAGDAWEIDLGSTTARQVALASTWDAAVQPSQA